MYKENNPKKKNKKAVLLLVTLSVFGIIAFKFVNKNEKIVDAYNDTEQSSCSNDVIEKNSEESTPILIDLKEGELINGLNGDTKAVLGTMSCTVANNKYTASSSCTIPSGKGSVSLQGWVSSSAEINMVSITVPVRLLSGIFSVQDSNRKITMLNPVYKPAGEQFDDRQLLVNTTPGEGSDSAKASILEGSVQNKAYSVKYSLSTSGDSGEGDATISEHAKNNCGELCNNPANSNPDKSNNIAAALEAYKFKTPGETDEDDSGIVQVSGVCENLEEVEISDSSVTKCFSVWKALVGSFGNLFSSSNWGSCDNDEEGCIKAEDIVVKMSPMFEETNSYMTVRNKSAMDPDTAKSRNPYFIVTSCSANVISNNITKLVPVKCLWDMSYLFEELKAAEYDDAGESDTPSETQYKKFLQEESTNRTDPLYTM